MNTRSSKYARGFSSAVIGLVCLCAVVVFPSCSKKPRQMIVGKWHIQGEQDVFEFQKDGTLINSGRSSTEKGHYFTDDNHMQVEMMLPNSNTLSLACEVDVRQDFANISFQMQTPKGPQGDKQTVRLARIR